MSEQSCCSFCEQLPSVSRPSRGSPSKCPLCKQDLWTSPDGVTQRLADDDSAAPRIAPRFLLAGLGVGLLALAIAGVAVTRLTWGPAESRPTPAAVIVQPAPTLAAAPVPVEPLELPPVQVKRAIPDNAARFKPAKSMEHLDKAAVKSFPPQYVDYPPAVKGITSPLPTAWHWTHAYVSEEILQRMLSDVPQLDLDPNYAANSAKGLAAWAKDIAKQNAKGHDGFIVQLRKDRADLAGLPFLLGKDCALPGDRARELAISSLKTRGLLAEAMAHRARTQSKRSPSSSDAEDVFWDNFELTASYVPAAHQILSAQTKDYRQELAQRLKTVKGPKATQALAKSALYDLDAEVRREAVKSLAARPQEEYLDEVARAFRHPWPQIARHASAAAVALKLRELIPDLVATFNEPDPTAPFTVKIDDRNQKKVIRELVRINHHRNCLLCHAPVGDAKAARDLPVGPVTSMDDALPPVNSAVYYSQRSRVTLVRADVTYLRQDFSAVQEVKDPGKWPAMQRFDFFVRTREVGADETFAALPEMTPHRQAVLDALHSLTGKTGPPRADAWQKEVLDAPERKSAAQAKSSR